jgi:hypothetical protein
MVIIGDYHGTAVGHLFPFRLHFVHKLDKVDWLVQFQLYMCMFSYQCFFSLYIILSY